MPPRRTHASAYKEMHRQANLESCPPSPAVALRRYKVRRSCVVLRCNLCNHGHCARTPWIGGACDDASTHGHVLCGRAEKFLPDPPARRNCLRMNAE